VKRLAAAAYGGDPDDLESFVRGGADECLVQRLDYVRSGDWQRSRVRLNLVPLFGTTKLQRV